MQLQSVRFKEPVMGPGKGSSASGSYYAGERPKGGQVNEAVWMASIELTRDGVVMTDKRGRVRRSERSNIVDYEQLGDHLEDRERTEQKEQSK